MPELWLTDPEERTVAIWRPGADAPERVREAVPWQAGGRRFELSLDELFRE